MPVCVLILLFNKLHRSASIYGYYKTQLCASSVICCSFIALSHIKAPAPTPYLLSFQTMTQTDLQMLFTYGTLRDIYTSLPDSVRRICPPTVLNGNEQRLGTAILPAYNLYDVGKCPGILPSSDPSSIVHGDLFTVSSDSLRVLDDYEGYGIGYSAPWECIRKAIDVIGGDGQPIRAWVYVYNWPLKSCSRPIPHGDYIYWLAEPAKKDDDFDEYVGKLTKNGIDIRPSATGHDVRVST